MKSDKSHCHCDTCVHLLRSPPFPLQRSNRQTPQTDEGQPTSRPPPLPPPPLPNPPALHFRPPPQRKTARPNPAPPKLLLLIHHPTSFPFSLTKSGIRVLKDINKSSFFAPSRVHSLLINATSPKTGATFFRDGCFSAVNALFLGPGKQSLRSLWREATTGADAQEATACPTTTPCKGVVGLPQSELRDRLRPVKSRVSQF